MEFLKTILNKILPGAKKGIGIFISYDSTVEIVEYDYDLGEINNYRKMEFQYDLALREINVENFEIVLQNILKNFDITAQIPVSLTLPSIFISKKILPLDLQGEEVYTALISETEKNYIFKKSEPKVSWNIVSINKENQLNNILYSALQKNIIEKLEAVFKRQGLKLLSIETSYSAFIRGLSVSGAVDDYIEKNLNWCVFLIKNNINAAIILKGSQVVNIIESPLALNSLETDDLYPVLSSNLFEKIQDINIDALAIINYSKIIDSEKLAGYLNFNCPIIHIENNRIKGEPLFKFIADPANEPISPEVIGASCRKNAPVKFSFNFLETQGQDELPPFLSHLGIAGNPLHIILLLLIAVTFVLISFISLISIPINASLDEQDKKLTVQCTQYQEKINKPKTKIFDLYNTVQTGFTNNEKIITSFDAISAVIPEKVWIKSISINEKSEASIQGRAFSVEEIVNYYQNLLSVAKFNNFKIKSIKAVGDTTVIAGNEPDVSINPVGGNTTSSLPGSLPQPQGSIPALPPLPRQGGSLPALPPPPPSTPSSGSPIISPESGSKYYEFDFGNPDNTKTNSDNSGKNPNDTKSLISGLSNIGKDLKLGK